MRWTRLCVFAGAGAGDDDHVLVEVLDDGIACGLIGEGRHVVASPSARAA